MEFNADFTLFPEQSFTDLEAITAHFNEFDRLTAIFNANLTFANKTEAGFGEWCFFANERIARLDNARFVLPFDLRYLVDSEVDRFRCWRRDMQRTVHRAWQDVKVARQALIDLPIQHGEFEPLFGDVEQDGEIYDEHDGEYAVCPLFGCDPVVEEEGNDDNTPLKEKYMHDSLMPVFNPLLTIPQTLAASEHRSNPTDPVSTTGSDNLKDRRGTPLTPEQIDDLLVFWGTPELIEQHHRSRLLGDLEREDRTPSQTSKEEKEVLIYEWLDGLPEQETACRGNAE